MGHPLCRLPCISCLLLSRNIFHSPCYCLRPAHPGAKFDGKGSNISRLGRGTWRKSSARHSVPFIMDSGSALVGDNKGRMECYVGMLSSSTRMFGQLVSLLGCPTQRDRLAKTNSRSNARATKVSAQPYSLYAK